MSPYFSVSAARTDTGNRNCSLFLLTSCPESASEQDLWAAVLTQWEMALREECVLWFVGSAPDWGGGVTGGKQPSHAGNKYGWKRAAT